MAARAKNRKIFKRHLLCSQCPDFKVISQKCSSYGPLPKLLKSSAWLNKLATRARKKKILNISSLASGLISKWFHRNIPFIPLYQKLPKWFFSAEEKRVTRAKNRKTFKQHLLGQWQDFKIISHQCSSYASLSKSLKWFCSAEQNGCQS